MAEQTPTPPNTGTPERLIAKARAVLLFERLWPIAVMLACCVALFLIASWLGFWLSTPPWAHVAGLAVLGAAVIAALSTLLRVRWPDRTAALARLDRDSGVSHRPVSGANDALANGSTDPSTRALWDLHRRRLQAIGTRVRVVPPSPRVVDIDRYAVRAAVVLAIVASAFVAGPEKYGRIASAFAWRSADASPGIRIDAWIDPPGYTGRPPLVLLGPSRTPDSHQQAVFSAPVGSSVVVRVAGTDAAAISSTGALRPAPVPASAAKAPVSASAPSVADSRFALAGDGELRIAREGSAPETFALKAIPDLPPRIRLVGTPKGNARGTLGLGYAIEDDYGVTGAEARFSNPVVRGRPVTGRALVEPPRGTLALPSMPGGLGEGKTTLDLSDHPWAGAQVSMTLSARDEAGNVGETTPTTLTLPSKPFANPLARALVEQRRDLILDPDDRAGVATALDALQIAPDAFDVPLGVYLGLHTAQGRLAAAKTDAALLEVADLLWQMALRIENGDLDKTEQDLRAAQKALHDALERGAPPDEIKKLTEALRQQMDKFLSEMMQNRDKNAAENDKSTPDRNSRTITDKDLKSMMDRMEDAARRGDMAEAQRLLDQLNSIMENLKTAKRGEAQSQANREMNRSMSDLNRMMQEQGDVRDKTFQENGRDRNEAQQGDEDDAGADQDSGQKPGSGDPSGQSAQPGSGRKPGQKGKGSPGFGDLQDRQNALGGQLDALQRKLRGLGLKGEQGLADAEQAMKEAGEALGKGQGGAAVEAQGRALEGLQRGAGGLQQQMAQEGGQDGNPAEGQGGEGEDMQQGEDLDPLGRPRQGRGSSQSHDLDVSGGLAARAQQVLQELRRRLGDPTRTQDEQNYLERLLQRY